jgi:protein SCO1/2
LSQIIGDPYGTRLETMAIAALVLSYASVLHAAVIQSDMSKDGAEPSAHTTLPLNLPLQRDDGSTKPLQFWLGSKPSLWVLANYTCETLCRPVISIVTVTFDFGQEDIYDRLQVLAAK